MKHDHEQLLLAAEDPGFTPGIRQLPALLELLGDVDERNSRRLVRAAARAGRAAATAACEGFASNAAPARARRCELVGRVALSAPDGELITWLQGRLEDDDPRTRRRAITALGKLGDPASEAVLLAAWQRTAQLAEQRVLAEALGKTGGEHALAALKEAPQGDAELHRVVTQACLKIERSLRRSPNDAIDTQAKPTRPFQVLLHTRAGIEPILLEELAPQISGRIAGRGRVAITLDGPISQLWRARTFLHLGFPLAVTHVATHNTGSESTSDAITEAVVRALTSDLALAIMRSFSRGTLRYRLEWASGGARRAATWATAAEIARRQPELINDSRQALWEAVVVERPRGDKTLVAVELWPRALADPRFDYRTRTLPASSNPTLAAALARVGGAFDDDVVWDPFAGAGTELIERALLGPYRRLYGSDNDSAALEAAAENLRRAATTEAVLSLGDVRSYRPPEAVSLVITNPPMGRRLLEKRSIAPLLRSMLSQATAVLHPQGRIVIISPIPEATVAHAGTLGLRAIEQRPVDMGGFSAELQAFRRR